MHLRAAGTLVIAALAFCAAQDIQPAGTTDVTTATAAVLTADGAKPADGEPMVMAAMLRQGPLPAAPTTSIGEGLSNFKTLKALLAKAGIDASAIFPSCADYAKAVEKAGSKATMTLLFAPTDAAFQNLEAPVTEFLSSPDNVEGLKAVLFSHVTTPDLNSDVVAALASPNPPTLKNAANDVLFVTNEDGKMWLNTDFAAKDFAVSQQDPQPFCDGIIVAMDDVIFPTGIQAQVKEFRLAMGSDGAVIRPTTMAEATFRIENGFGVSGYIRFIQPAAGGPTAVRVSVQASGSQLNAGRTFQNWEIHNLPVNAWTDRRIRCSSDQVGGLYDPYSAGNCTGTGDAAVCPVGDLSGVFGPLSSTDQGAYQNSFQAAAGNIALNGPYAVTGRSVVIYDQSGLPWVCATILPIPSPAVITLGPVSLPFTTLSPDTLIFGTDSPFSDAPTSLVPTSSAPVTAEPTTPTPTNVDDTAAPTLAPTSPSPTEAPRCHADFDLNCFDPDLYDCKGCCTTGLAADGVTSCWDSQGQYSYERCCQKTWQVDSQNNFKDRYATWCPAVKDVYCFDDIYPCQTCCSSGKSIYNLPCWNNVYTQARCCKTPEELNPVWVQQQQWSSGSGGETGGSYRPAQCADANAMCQAWAAFGECQGVQAGWMLETCPSACGVCRGGRRQAVRGLRLAVDGSLVDSRGNPAPTPEQVQQANGGVNVRAVSLGSVGAGLLVASAAVTFIVARRFRARQSAPATASELSTITAASTV